MLKNILGVILGYVAMAVFVFVAFSLAYLLIGTDGAFQPNSYDVTGVWVITSIILGIVGALLGGFVCAILARSSHAPLVLAGLVLVLGLVMALPTLRTSGASETTIRHEEIGSFEAMQHAQQPPWVALLNPLLGAAGIVAGARLKRGRKQASNQD